MRAERCAGSWHGGFRLCTPVLDRTCGPRNHDPVRHHCLACSRHRDLGTRWWGAERTRWRAGQDRGCGARDGQDECDVRKVTSQCFSSILASLVHGDGNLFLSLFFFPYAAAFLPLLRHDIPHPDIDSLAGRESESHQFSVPDFLHTDVAKCWNVLTVFI